jgi:hypothetical protein
VISISAIVGLVLVLVCGLIAIYVHHRPFAGAVPSVEGAAATADQAVAAGADLKGCLPPFFPRSATEIHWWRAPGTRLPAMTCHASEESLTLLGRRDWVKLSPPAQRFRRRVDAAGGLVAGRSAEPAAVRSVERLDDLLDPPG